MKILVGTGIVAGVQNAVVKSIYNITDEYKTSNPDMVEVEVDGIEEEGVLLGNMVRNINSLMLVDGSLVYSPELETFYLDKLNKHAREVEGRKLAGLLAMKELGKLTTSETQELDMLVTKLSKRV